MLDNAAWLDWAGRGVLATGDSVTQPDLNLALVDCAWRGVKTIYLCGDEPPYVSASSASAWVQQLAYCKLFRDCGSLLTDGRLFLKLLHTGSNRKLVAMPAAGWVGDAAPVTARRAMLALDAALFRRCGMGIVKTPALTGALLWARRHAKAVTQWEKNLRELVWQTSGQGRFECCPDPSLTELPGLYQLDGRLMYACSAMSISTGDEPEHEERPLAGWADGEEDVPGWLGFTPGRYHVRFRAPDGWNHVGLLGLEAQRNWIWPTSAKERRHTWQTWCDARELALAIENGWEIDILARIVTRRTERRSWARPARGWAEDILEAGKLLQGAPDAAICERAIRAVIIQGIGLMFRRTKQVTKQAAPGELAPAGHVRGSVRELADGSQEWEEYEEISRYSEQYCRPEIAAAIYADTRRRLLKQTSKQFGMEYATGALTLPRSQVVGFALDGIYTTVDPGWVDDGQPGRYRVKHKMLGATAKIPKSVADLWKITGECPEEV